MAILVLVVVAGYLVWLRGRVGVEEVASPSPSVEPSPMLPSPTIEATTSTKPKTSTPSSTTQ